MKISSLGQDIRSFFFGSGKGNAPAQQTEVTVKTPEPAGDSISLTSSAKSGSPSTSSSAVKQTGSGTAAEKSIFSKKEKTPEKPKRENFSSDELYDSSLVEWQVAGVQQLIEKYPNAVVRGEVYHGCDLPPEVVFEKGIPEKGGQDFDLIRHQRQKDAQGNPSGSNSALRGSCADARTPAGFTGEGGWVYKLVPVGGGVDLNTALFGQTVQEGFGKANLMHGETEICIGSRQPAWRIAGCFQVGDFFESAQCYRLGKFIENPNYDPSR